MNIGSTLRCHRSAPVRSWTLHSRSKVIVPAGPQKSGLEWLSAVVGGGRFVCGEDTLSTNSLFIWPLGKALARRLRRAAA